MRPGLYLVGSVRRSLVKFIDKKIPLQLKTNYIN